MAYTSYIMIVLGAFACIMGIRIMRDPVFAQKYVETSPKALLWRKLFGVERATKLTRTVFAPLGIVIGAMLVVFGIMWSF